MSIMNTEIYEALRSAEGVSEDQAMAAAESVASYENRFAKIERDLLILKWMVGGVLLGVFAPIVKAFIS